MTKANKLKKKAHAIMREILLLRDKKCVCPPPDRGHTKVLQAGHLIPGTKGGTYFDLYNVHIQCSACNGRHVRFEKYYVGWFIENFGKSEYLRLCKDSENAGLKIYELEEIIVQLGMIKERMEKDKSFKPYFAQQEILSGAWQTKETRKE